MLIKASFIIIFSFFPFYLNNESFHSPYIPLVVLNFAHIFFQYKNSTGIIDRQIEVKDSY